ncbi:MAG: sensor signal transduction histidine kinase [Betaproteobacteria bacterium]|nr:sensor signal transduction histidine kinase [Betaproteobacteria bacterium]
MASEGPKGQERADGAPRGGETAGMPAGDARRDPFDALFDSGMHAALLDAADIGCWTFEIPGGAGYRSSSMFRTLGYADVVADWTHGDFLRCLHPDDRERVEAAHEAARLGDGRYEAEFRVLWPDATVHWLSARGRFDYDAAGNAVRMSWVQFDVTQRKTAELELAASRARFESVIDLSQDGILIHHRGKIRYANRAAARLLGACSPEILVGLSLPEFITPDMRVLASRQLDRLFDQGGALPYVESKMIRLDGAVIDVELAATATWEEGEQVVHTQIRDIADRKRHEREILALNHSLEERVQARTRELAAANRELESYSYMVAHDLRAPLRAISGFSGMLQESLAQQLDREQRRFLGIIVGNVERMNKLIDGLLQFSRSARGSLSPQPADTRALVDAVILELPGHERAQFEIGALPALLADPVLLRQILINLIDNALKYSRGQAQPKIEISARLLAGMDVIRIADNGVGFDAAYAHKLFGVFQRLHSLQEFEGAGIGLAIVRKIVERHGGQVWAEGAVGEGARFFFSLPRQGGEAAGPKEKTGGF